MNTVQSSYKIYLVMLDQNWNTKYYRKYLLFIEHESSNVISSVNPFGWVTADLYSVYPT